PKVPARESRTLIFGYVVGRANFFPFLQRVENRNDSNPRCAGPDLAHVPSLATDHPVHVEESGARTSGPDRRYGGAAVEPKEQTSGFTVELVLDVVEREPDELLLGDRPDREADHLSIAYLVNEAVDRVPASSKGEHRSAKTKSLDERALPCVVRADQ